MKRHNALTPSQVDRMHSAFEEGRRPVLRRPSQERWDTRGCTMLLAALPLALLFLLVAWWVARVIMEAIR